MSRWHSYGVGQYRASESHTFIGNRLYALDSTKPPILVCPGRGQTSDNEVLTGWIGDVVAALAEAGFPVLAADMGGTTSHGNAASAAAVGDARTYANAPFGAKSGKVGLLGTSMGALPALRYYMDNPGNVACFCGGVPNVNLQNVHDVTRPDIATEIETAHGGAGGYATYLTNYNPSAHTSSFAGLPMQLHYSTDDNNITPSTVTSFGAATGAQVISLGAVGHNPAGMDTGLVVAFFEQYLFHGYAGDPNAVVPAALHGAGRGQ